MNEVRQMLRNKNITTVQLNNNIIKYVRNKHFPIIDKYRLLRNGSIIKTDICNKFSSSEGISTYSISVDQDNKIIDITVEGKHKNAMIDGTYCNDLAAYALSNKILLSKQFIDELEDSFKTEYIY